MDTQRRSKPTRIRRDSVLVKSNAEVAEELRENPGVWFMVADERDLSRSHTFSQTAYRINLNYEGGEGLVAFASDDTGRFNATASRNFKLPDGTVVPLTIHARWVPNEPGS